MVSKTLGAASVMWLLVPTAAMAQAAEGPGYGPHYWAGGWHGWVFGPIMMILFFAIAVGIAVVVVRWLGGIGPGADRMGAGKTPLDILKERYARGEIDRQEFEERRQVLGE